MVFDLERAEAEQNKEMGLENLDGIIQEQFGVSEMTQAEIDAKESEKKEALGKLTLYGQEFKHPTHNFAIEQVMYDKAKFFQMTITILSALPEAERLYSMFFHIKDYGLFGDGAELKDTDNERLINVLCIKIENKHGMTKLTCSVPEPEDAFWLFKKCFSFNANWVISLIPTSECTTTDIAKIKTMVE